MPANKPMHFEKYDSQLPQIVKANNPGLYKQREDELKVKQQNFSYAPIGGVKGMPRSVRFIITSISFKLNMVYCTIEPLRASRSSRYASLI